jgi:beta/gamma crystallin
VVAVYSEQNLSGSTFETRDNQPRLDLNQWQNQISSIIVKSGTWDFYPDVQFRGQALRLAPGSYPVLEQNWTKAIGSFMCVK